MSNRKRKRKEESFNLIEVKPLTPNQNKALKAKNNLVLHGVLEQERAFLLVI